MKKTTNNTIDIVGAICDGLFTMWLVNEVIGAGATFLSYCFSSL